MNKTAKYLAFDCETGGLDPQNQSLLTVYFSVLTEDFDLIDDLYLELNANAFGGVYRVTTGALEVNKIDLVEHDKRAIHPDACKRKLIHMLDKYGKLIPIGHNVDFDIGFIKAQLLPEPEYGKYISHRKLCTSTLARFLRMTGKIGGGGSLENLCKTLNVEVFGGFHDAKADTQATVDCLKKMLEIIK